MKANIDGYYESMRVGTADNLTPRGDASEEIIMNRTAGGNNAIESGDALIKSIKGNSLTITQVVNIEALRGDEYFTIEQYKDNGVKCKPSGQSFDPGSLNWSSGWLRLSSNLLRDHIYYYSLKYTRIAKRTDVGEFTPKDVYLSAFGDKHEVEIGIPKVLCNIKTINSNNCNLTLNDCTVTVENIQLVNLTLMFGAGNEPATPEEFAHRLGYDSIEQVPYIPYNEGEIVSCNAFGIRTTDDEGDTYERKWASTMQKYFPRGLQSVGNVYDEITPTKAIKRISNNREILRQPEEYPYDELNLSMRVSPGCKEEAIIPKGALSTPLRMDVVYPIDAYGTIVRNRQHIGNLSSLQTQAKADLVSAINELKEVLSTLAVKSESNERNITQLRADTDGIITDWGVDNRTLPLLCGQPMILFGHGAPAKGVVPDNWIQFDPVSGQGYDWNGTPSVLGQQYLDVDVSAGGFYIAARDKDMGLKWINC